MITYLNTDKLTVQLQELLTESLHKMCDGEEYEGYFDWILDEGDGYVENLVETINKDMCVYLHQSDHNIVGNFKNIEYDWEGTVGTHDCKGIYLTQVVELLDNNEDNETTNEFKDFALDWFWEAFGTFGITYKFENMLSDMIYEYEQENS